MAFDGRNLVRIGGQRQAQAIWTYETPDDIATVIASGYFNTAAFELTKKDYIFTHSTTTDVSYIVQVTSETNAKPVTTKAVSTLEAQGQATGWVTISDSTYTSGSPFAITNGVRTKLDLNSDSTIEAYAPVGSTADTYYNPTTKLLFGDDVGDSFVFRLSFTCQPSAVNTSFLLELDIGGSQGVILSRVQTLTKGTNVQAYTTSNAIFTLGTFQANGGTIYITPDGGNLDVWDMSLHIQKTHSGAV